MALRQVAGDRVSELLRKQMIFAENICHLILMLIDRGYGVTYSEVYRTPEQAALNASKGIGIANSLHTLRLAADLNLFIDGMYQQESDKYREAGRIWKTLHSDNRWGGDFTKADGNHFSMMHDGVM